jgi:hypothetical protein
MKQLVFFVVVIIRIKIYHLLTVLTFGCFPSVCFIFVVYTIHLDDKQISA